MSEYLRRDERYALGLFVGWIAGPGTDVAVTSPQVTVVHHVVRHIVHHVTEHRYHDDTVTAEVVTPAEAEPAPLPARRPMWAIPGGSREP